MMETDIKTTAAESPEDNKRTCEFIESLPEEILAKFILHAPTPDFAEPFDMHAVGCVTCAKRIRAATGTYLENHPDLAPPEKVEQLRHALLKRS